ncbi:MAG: TonB-dependent receptor [Bacteroidales bacterium]|nr:TonB-dependent receptor [Bacteroidales bacterium]
MSSVKRILLVFVCALSCLGLRAQGFSLSGVVTEKNTGNPVEFATVLVEASEQWAVADAKGRFTIKDISVPKSVITVACLGYVTYSIEISITKDIPSFKVQLAVDNLTLEKAVVTAKENGNSATTARTIDKTALEHVQMMNVSDISGLLPGGTTRSSALTAEQQFNIRAGSGENGFSSFGTAVEVDGVRLSNNASYLDVRNYGIKGVSTNNIASANVESVEVISGVPSVEYGDIGSGIVKVNTKKGKTPWQLTLSTSPRTKQLSVSKGFALGYSRSGAAAGVLNASMEYTRSISEQMSPYTSYVRRQVSLVYSNFFNTGAFQSKPLRISAALTGNLGGLDNSADPDLLVGTYSRKRDNALRGSFTANWLLSLDWITNLEFSASAVYGDRLASENKQYHQSVTEIALHARGQGYYMSAPYVPGGENPVVMIPAGTWYNVMSVDDRPFTAKATLKANWARHFGAVSSKLKIGADWSADSNFGVGLYSEDISQAPSYREYRYCDNPWMHNIAAYVEDNLMIPAGSGRINIIAGLRNDNTVIRGSAYGVTSSLSPRFNAKYTVLEEKGRRGRFVRSLAFRGSWGVAVKQPSFSILYPVPGYLDINTFTSTASADNVVYRAFYVHPSTIEYNSALRWQKNHQSELGVEANLAGNKMSLVAFWNRTLDTYQLNTDYDRFTYNYTGTADVQGLPIPAGDRVYSLDPVTGIVTVADKTGRYTSVQAPHTELKQLISRTFENNEPGPVDRYGLEWVLEFKEIKPIHTAIRVDGRFYSYRSTLCNLIEYSPYTTTGRDGMPFKYIGYYYGSNQVANGSESRSLSNNITITTHIPKVRMVLSVKLEASLLNYSRALSERPGGKRTYVVQDRADVLGFDPSASVYDGESYAVLFPDYYASFDNPVREPFLDKLRWAKDNDPELYSDLSKLVVTSNYLYQFGKEYLSPFFSANVSVTKEIGDFASVSFYANNFFNNMGQVYNTKTKVYESVYKYIPSFYYGLTVRFKF